MLTVLITGAGGFIGSALVRYFLAQGWNVVGAGRRRPACFPDRAQWRNYDLAWTAIPSDFFANVDVLIHAAMIREEYDVNVAGSTLLLEQARAHGIQRIVFLSSLAAHEGALSQYGKHKFALQQRFERGGALVVRPGLVEGDGGSFGAMCEYLRSNRFMPLFGGGRQPMQTVEIDDLCRAIYSGVDRDVRGTFTVATIEPVSYRTFYSDLSRRLGARVTYVPVPFWLADLAVRLAQAAGVKLPIDRDNLLGLKAMRVDRGPRLD